MIQRTLLGTIVLASSLTAQKGPFGTPKPIGGPRLFPAAAVAADVDLDGRKDVIVGNAFSLDPLGPMSVHLLDASWRMRGHEALPITREPGLVAHQNIATVDSNRDWLPDFVAFSSRGTISVHTHQGHTRDHKRQPRFALQGKLKPLNLFGQLNHSFAQLHLYGIECDDFDGDGFEDVAFVGDARFFYDVLGSTGISFLRFDASGAVMSEQTIAVGRFVDLAKGDLDGDGRMDLVGLSPDGSVTIALQQARGRYSKTRVRISKPFEADRIGLSDVNSDGRADLLLSKQKHSKIYVHFSDRRGNPSDSTIIEAGLQPGEMIEDFEAGDLDGDGHMDVVALVAADFGRPKLLSLRPGLKPSLVVWQKLEILASIRTSPMPVYARYLVLDDLDGDGDDDVIISSSGDVHKKSLHQYIVLNESKRKNGYISIGKATVGSNGLNPKISVMGRGALGKRFAMRLADAPGGKTRAALILGTRREPRSFAGFSLHTFPLYSFGVETRGRGDGYGWNVIEFRVPLGATELLGRPYYFQWIVADKGAPNPLGLSATCAIEMRLASH